VSHAHLDRGRDHGVAAWLAQLAPDRLRELASGYAAGLFADGLTVYRAAEDRFAAIAPTLSPEPIADAELAALAADARTLLAATVKVALWTLSDSPDSRAQAARLYAGFTPLEHECLRRDPGRLAQVATARVDYFRGADGVARALELNATIPAMQGYSDVILHRWLRSVGAARGLVADRIEELVRQAGSNTADLLASLVAHYRRAGGGAERPSILIVSRRGDSQLGELRHYQRAFTAAGHRTAQVWVDEVQLDAAGRLVARGERFDLLYRHIFARKVEPGTPMARLLLDPGPNVVLNPVLSPLEVKGLLGLLSDPWVQAAAGLDAAERAAVALRVPWTRVCAHEPATLADGTRVPDLAAWVAASEHGQRLVLKRSWDYGGKGVFIGPDVVGGGDAIRAKLAETYGPPCASWPELVSRAAADPNVWVVQELVPPVPTRHLLVEDAGARPAWREMFVDINAYANLGVLPVPRGGVCRASGSRIVNIAGGGGVAPLVQASVLEGLMG
jgi:hypothetical protein